MCMCMYQPVSLSACLCAGAIGQIEYVRSRPSDGGGVLCAFAGQRSANVTYDELLRRYQVLLLWFRV